MTRLTVILLVWVLSSEGFAGPLVSIFVRPPFKPREDTAFTSMSYEERDRFLKFGKKNPRTWTGHMALELPEESGSGMKIIGWRPQLPQGEDAVKKLRKRQAFPGYWADESLWVVKGVGHPFTPTYKFSFEVSADDLARIWRNIRAIQDSKHAYQLGFPDGTNGTFATNAYNCVTVFVQVFSGTSVDVGFIPSSGSMYAIVEYLKPKATLWSPRRWTCEQLQAVFERD